MSDTTTIIELTIAPAELSNIVQNWSMETGFSIHEKIENKVFYKKTHPYSTYWLSVESHAQSAKLTAWLAPKKLEPDGTGNAWIGYKTPVTNPFAVGQAAIYKKQFNELVTTLQARSPDLVKKTSNQVQLKMDKGTIIQGLAGIGVIRVLLGILNVISSNSFIQAYPDLAKVGLYNGILDITIGVFAYTSSRLLKNGNVAGIWLYVGSIAINVVYSLMMGHKLPYFALVFDGFLVWHLISLKKDGKL